MAISGRIKTFRQHWTSVIPFDEAVQNEDGEIQILQQTARVWSISKGETSEIPAWHKYNLIPNSESGADEYTEQMWLIKSLVYDAAGGRPSEMQALYSDTLYHLYEIITLKKSAEYSGR